MKGRRGYWRMGVFLRIGATPHTEMWCQCVTRTLWKNKLLYELYIIFGFEEKYNGFVTGEKEA